MRAAPVAAAAAIACGCAHPPPAGDWTEREVGLGQSHVEERHRASGIAQPEVGARPAWSAQQIATLTQAQIDAMPEPDVLAALAVIGDAPPSALLAARAARLAYHRGDDAAARALFARAKNQPAAASPMPDPPAIQRETIAVLLPLSGRYAAIGGELRAAIELAPAEGTRWKFIDTRGDPTGAADAVDAAVAAGAVAILGPVGTREAVAAARRAVLRGLPIGLLAPADGADPADGVFRLASSPADEARAVAKLAADENYPTVGVLSPRDDVGDAAAIAFASAATARGLDVTARGTYDPTGGDLAADVKKFLNLDPATNPELARHLARGGRHGKPDQAWATFEPDVPFALLYIPDRYDRAALVAAYLPYDNVELRTTETPDLHMLARKHGGVVPQVVQLVGGAGWHDPSLPIRGGEPLQGARIVDVWAAEHGGDAAAQFARAFAARTGHAASGVVAEAYDAATLIAHARTSIGGGGDPRRAMQDALARGRLDDGACGSAAIGGNGELTREWTVLEVSGDDFAVSQ